MISRRVKLPNNKKIPLFTLGSIYSNDASGAEQMPETNKILIKDNRATKATIYQVRP